jgi:2-methylaconitate cis-trans-isomerase PrpF
MLMRGGTSKGPLFLASDLPLEAEARDRLLLSIMGSPDVRQINGIGGGDALTSQALIVQRSTHPGTDIEYLFAQVAVGHGSVDTRPNCGNMLAAVAAFSIERGLVTAEVGRTRVRMYNVNTGKVVEAVVNTPSAKVTYEGDARIDGVPGTGAPIELSFLDPVGATTGRLLPTGSPFDSIEGVPVSCVDFSIPVVMIDAGSLGMTGYETKAQLDADPVLLAKLERVRRKAGALMGLGEVAESVLPKVALLARARHGGTISSRFFVPWNCHVAHSTSGAICIAAACLTPGTIAADLASSRAGTPIRVVIEHPSGAIETRLEGTRALDDEPMRIARASVVLTARPLFDGLAPLRLHDWESAA